MTKSVEEETKCALCGHVSKQWVMTSTSAWGSPSLDTRPPAPQGCNLELWIYTCPSCGYCSPCISENIKGSSEMVGTDPYRKQLDNPEFPKLANAFLCHSMLEEAIGNYASAGFSCIHAAWVCDDINYNDALEETPEYQIQQQLIQEAIISAKRCRVEAIRLLTKARKTGQHFGEELGAEEALLSDLLRRSDQFDKTICICNETLKRNPGEIIEGILRLQICLAENYDDRAYDLDLIDILITIPDLVMSLDDNDDVAELLAAITALGEYGFEAEDAIPGLLKALQNTDCTVREKAAWAIGEIGNKDAFYPLDCAMSDSTIRNKLNAYRLADEASYVSMSALEQYLKDEGLWDSLTRKKALETIGEEAVQALVQALGDDAVWSAAVTSLGQIGHLETIPDLIRSTKNKDYGQHKDLARALRKMGDPKKKYRWLAIPAVSDALCHIGDTSVMMKLLCDSDEFLRWVGIMSIAALRNMEFLPVLIDTLKNDKSAAVRMEAAEGLLNIGREANEAVYSVVDLLKTEKDMVVRARLLEALGWFGRDEAVPALADALKDKKSREMREIIKTLGKIGSKQAIACLNETLSDKDWQRRINAMQILLIKGDRSSIPALEKALKDKIPWIRGSAAEALERINSIPEKRTHRRRRAVKRRS